MPRTAVINVVGLTPALLGPAMPRLNAWARGGKMVGVRPPLPAVTCSVQATYLTGRRPSEHGVVGNGWYAREDCEVRFWRQSNKLVQAPKLWEAARLLDPGFTCANLFWWFNMYSSVDYAITPRPMYPADGRKIPDVYTKPIELRALIQQALGRFPLFDFWGPRASIRSSRWIADAARFIEERHAPSLNLVYLPHLDYALQRLGLNDPGIEPELRAIDAVCADLIEDFERRGVQVIVLSEYGITDVSRPVHINRLLRENGLLAVREELGREILDAGASIAFAVADHQIAHVYVNEPERLTEVRWLLSRLDGVERVLDAAGKREEGLYHERAGDLVAIARPDAWFTYYYWLDDHRAPDFARTVDIHRKPGYDPAELFFDPALRVPALRVGWKLLKSRAGMRALMDVVPLDAGLVRGSHGRLPSLPANGPLFITQRSDLLSANAGTIDATEVYSLILQHCVRARNRSERAIRG